MADHARLAVTGALQFASDLGNAASLGFLRADVAAAQINHIDTAEAARQPGVLAVWTAADLSLPRYGQIDVAESYLQPPLATDEVRYVGERIVAIVAEQQAQVLDAVEHIVIDYELMRPRLDPTRAHLTFTATEQLSTEEPLSAPTVQLSAHNPRVAVAPLEPWVAVATPIDATTTLLELGLSLIHI